MMVKFYNSDGFYSKHLTQKEEMDVLWPSLMGTTTMIIRREPCPFCKGSVSFINITGGETGDKCFAEHNDVEEAEEF